MSRFYLKIILLVGLFALVDRYLGNWYAAAPIGGNAPFCQTTSPADEVCSGTRSQPTFLPIFPPQQSPPCKETQISETGAPERRTTIFVEPTEAPPLPTTNQNFAASSDRWLRNRELFELMAKTTHAIFSEANTDKERSSLPQTGQNHWISNAEQAPHSAHPSHIATWFEHQKNWGVPNPFAFEKLTPDSNGWKVERLPSINKMDRVALVSMERDLPEISGVLPEAERVPTAVFGSENFLLAAEPKLGAHWKEQRPNPDPRTFAIEPQRSDFPLDPVNPHQSYDPSADQAIYEGKQLYANQRPLLELGRPWYQLGQLSPGSDLLGKHNPVEPQFIIYGDARTAFANNVQNGDAAALAAFQANLNFDLKITSTERLVMFASPFTNGLESTGFDFSENRTLNNLNTNILFGYLEGDLGAIAGGLTNQTYPFDLPFAAGIVPLLFQNGVWMEDAILGFALTIPSRSNPALDISNMDLTFFAGYDKLISDAFLGDDSAAKIYGLAAFVEALNGYIELNYAFIEDRTFFNRSYHNIGMGFTRRYGRFVSNSTRMILNLGQNPDGIAQTADGLLLLSENSLISGLPSTIVPYFNLFAGFDRPQSAARNGLAGGVLRNTGILFETDNLTGYPTLDATANDSFGAAFGLNLLASDFSQQLVLETSFLNVMGADPNRNAPGNQYGLGVRYQLPLTNAVIFRADAMYGILNGTDDIHGARVELRQKF